MGNIRFQSKDEGTSQVTEIVDPAVLDEVGSILKFDASAMGKALTTRRLKARCRRRNFFSSRAREPRELREPSLAGDRDRAARVARGLASRDGRQAAARR